MRYYETIYIVHPDFEDSRLDEIMSSVDKQIEKNCDEIVNSYVWGKRRLAYDINKISYGTYVIVHYSAKNSFMKELNSWMKIQENILANMTIRLEEPPTQKEEKKVDQNKSVNIDNIKNNEDQEDVKGNVDDDMKDKEELEVKE
tara:strand:- start:5507 stop:5938 length:432 start_codon:yes stop_codon:yes gene_type:complete